MTTPIQKKECFFPNDDVPDILRNLGFNLFIIANNHKEAGLRETKSALGNAAFGARTYEEANNPQSSRGKWP
jgi:hypothetical protein